MDTYKFHLQKLLDIRLDNEKESTRFFIESQRQKILVEQKLSVLKDNYQRFNVLKKGETIVEQKIKNNYLNALNSNINETNNELKIKDELVDIKRSDLKQRQIERKTVESIKENRLQAFIEEQERKERVVNDELGLYAFMRSFERR